jgi:hypothetical protein
MSIFRKVKEIFQQDKQYFAEQAKRLFNTDEARQMFRQKTRNTYNRSKWMPHQGKQECARRRLRMQKI